MLNPALNNLCSMIHPEYGVKAPLWIKYRLAYQGGEEFIQKYCYRYSRRELNSDFSDRKKLTYNPPYLTGTIDIIKNGLATKLSDVTRIGDPRYIEMIDKNVDLKNSSMKSWLTSEFIALLISVGERWILVDAPLSPEGATEADVEGFQPYIRAVSPEDILNWHYGKDNKLSAILMRETYEQIDKVYGLVKSIELRYRFMSLLKPGQTDIKTGVQGPGVLVRLMDEKEQDLVPPYLLNLTRIPMTEGYIAEPLCKNLADPQIGAMNLNSTDMQFLHRFNFPLYVQQVSSEERFLKPLGTEEDDDDLDSDPADDIDSQDTISTPRAATKRNQKNVGNGTGISYAEGLEVPTFISPPTANTELSFKKQESIGQIIRSTADLALISLSISAVEQSGKSKEADQVGKEEGMLHIASVLQNVENDLAEIIHEFFGSLVEYDVKYPTSFTLKTEAERNQQASELGKLASLVPSETYQKSLWHSIVDTLMSHKKTSSDMAEIHRQIDEWKWFDQSSERQTLVMKDQNMGLTDTAFAGLARGIDPAITAAASSESEEEAKKLSEGDLLLTKPTSKVKVNENSRKRDKQSGGEDSR